MMKCAKSSDVRPDLFMRILSGFCLCIASGDASNFRDGR